VVAQEVRAVFGNSGIGSTIYYLVILSVILILYTGGNTSFNGFPFLANYVASDRYLPRQLTSAVTAGLFQRHPGAWSRVALAHHHLKAQVNSLIALYAIGSSRASPWPARHGCPTPTRTHGQNGAGGWS